MKALLVMLGMSVGTPALAEHRITTTLAREEVPAPRTRDAAGKLDLRVAAPAATSERAATSGPAAASEPAGADLELLPMFQISDEETRVTKRESRSRVKIKPMSRITGTPRPHQYVPCDRRGEGAGDGTITGVTLSFKH